MTILQVLAALQLYMFSSREASAPLKCPPFACPFGIHGQGSFYTDAVLLVIMRFQSMSLMLPHGEKAF